MDRQITEAEMTETEELRAALGRIEKELAADEADPDSYEYIADLVAIVEAATNWLKLLEGGVVIPAAEGKDEEPYELGWCVEHHHAARRWSDGSWSCWWESVVEASGYHQPSDFRPLGAVIRSITETTMTDARQEAIDL